MSVVEAVIAKSVAVTVAKVVIFFMLHVKHGIGYYLSAEQRGQKNS